MLNESLQQAVNTLEETEFPKSVIVEVCGFCNLRCVMCPYPNLKRIRGVMRFDIYTRIVDEIASTDKDTQLWPAIMGEPLLLEKNIFEYIRYAKNRGIREVILNTNGMLLNSITYNKLASAGLDKIIVGVDAFSENTYSKIRVGGNYETVKKNILNALDIREENRGPEIILQFIIMDDNAHEVEQFKEYWLSKGATIKLRKRLGWGNAVSTNLEISPESSDRVPCPWLMRTMSIHWNGKVAQCDADYEGNYSPGDISKQTIYDIWNGELKSIRQKHWNKEFDFPPCSSCRDWQVGLSKILKP